MNGIKTYKEILSALNIKQQHIPSVSAIYSKNLKKTRKEIYRFFDIKTNYDQVKSVYLNRLLIYTLPNDHPIRVTYLKDSAEFDKVLLNLENRIISTSFIEDETPTIKNVNKLII